MKQKLYFLLLALFANFHFFGQSATHLNFDGIDDVVNCGNSINTVLDPLNTITVEAWVKSSTTSGLGVIVGNYANSNQSQMQFLLRRDINSYAFWIQGTGGFKSVSAANSVVLNTWQHVVGVWNGSDLKIYVDGNLAATTTGVNDSSFATTTNSMMIGNNQAGTGAEKFAGSIDDIRIWSTVRTKEQINGSKFCELQGSETGLLRYYKFDQGIDASNNTTVTSLIDATTNANNGTLINFALTSTTSNWLSGSPVTTGSIVPSIAIVTTPITYQVGETSTALTATTGGTGLLWYTSATGGVGSNSAPIPSTTTVGNTSYWVSSTNNLGCESERNPIVVIVDQMPPTTSFATQIYTGDDKTLENLQTIGTNIKWYTAATAGTLLQNNTVLTDGTTYYASQTVGGNESQTRLAIKAKRISDTAQNFCGKANPTIASLVSTPSNGTTATWYTDAVGGTALGNTTALTSGSYYVEQSGSNRVLVTVSVFNLAKPTVNSPVTYYKGDVPPNVLIASGGTGYKVYENETGGQGYAATEIPLGNSSPFTMTLWVASTNEFGCESDRQQISITLKEIETPTTPYTTQIYTGNDKTLNNIIISGTNIQWYNAATAGTLLPNTTSLADGTTYYAAQTRNGYESPTRLAITMKRISENSQWLAPSANPTIANLVTTPSSGASVKWFSTANGTTALNPGTALSSGTYYVEQIIPGAVETFTTEIDRAQTAIFSVAVQNDGKIVYGDGHGNLHRMNADGSNKTIFKSGLTTGDLIAKSDGSILMANGGSVIRINADGSVTTIKDSFTFLEGIAVQVDGKILIANIDFLEPSSVKRMNADGSVLETINTSIENPYSVAVEANGKILVADPNQTSIFRMNADGTNVVNVGSGFDYPSKILVQADGKILVLEGHAVKRMNADGTNIEILRDGIATPQDMNIDASGAIYVAELNANQDSFVIKIGVPSKTNRVPVVVNLFTNDECLGATTLNVGSNFADNSIEVDLSLATASTGIQAPTCGNYQGADVWYKVEVPSSGELNIKTGNLAGESTVNTAMAVYSGECGSLTAIDCNDDESASITTSSLALTNLTPGTTLYLRTWINPGNNNEKVKANTSTSKIASSKFTISAFSNATLSNETFKTVDFVVYPNPTSGELTIDAANLTNPSLSVFDLNGKLILSEQLQADKNALNFSALSNGVYLFKIKSQEGETVKKVVKN